MGSKIARVCPTGDDPRPQVGNLGLEQSVMRRRPRARLMLASLATLYITGTTIGHCEADGDGDTGRLVDGATLARADVCASAETAAGPLLPAAADPAQPPTATAASATMAAKTSGPGRPVCLMASMVSRH